MSVFVKLSSSATAPMLVFVRFALGLPLFLWVVRKKNIKMHWKAVPKNLTRSIAGIANLYAFYYALKMLPLVNALTLANTAPLFLPFIYLIWERLLVSKRKFFAIALGFIGVLVILRPSGSDLFAVSSILGLFAGFCRAIALFNVRSLAKVESTETILSYYFFIGAVLSFFPLLLDYKPLENPVQWLYIFLAGLMALGYQYTFTKACAVIQATKVSSINYFAVIFGGALGWWVFGEVPHLWVILGSGLIICGALIALLDKSAVRRFK
jgi:drug/metabolite transporter (DMT)-like permease